MSEDRRNAVPESDELLDSIDKHISRLIDECLIREEREESAE